MRKSLKVMAVSALVLAFSAPMQSSAQWWGPGYGYGPYHGPGYWGPGWWGPGFGRGLGDWFGFGDMFGDISFSMRGSGTGRGWGRGDGWGLYHPYHRGWGHPYGWGPHAGPWGTPAPQQQAASE